MASRGEVTTRSSVDAVPAELWRWATSERGINHELGPLLRMDVPTALGEVDAPASGLRLGRIWIRLLGGVPFDFDDLTLVEVEPGRRFLERSTMLSHRLWEHERMIDADSGGCLLTDRVAFVPRLGPPAATRPLVAAIFRHRHRRLCAWFGGRYLGQTVR